MQQHAGQARCRSASSERTDRPDASRGAASDDMVENSPPSHRVQALRHSLQRVFVLLVALRRWQPRRCRSLAVTLGRRSALLWTVAVTLDQLGGDREIGRRASLRKRRHGFLSKLGTFYRETVGGAQCGSYRSRAAAHAVRERLVTRRVLYTH